MNTAANQAPDLAEEVFSFLRNLPDTIRTEILFFVLIYASDMGSMESETFLPSIEEALIKTNGLQRMGATLRIIGALDFILQRSVDKLIDLPQVTAILSDKRPDLADRISARQPLALKHEQSALSSWKQMRATLLTHENLSRYEDRLLMPPHLRPDRS